MAFLSYLSDVARPHTFDLLLGGTGESSLLFSPVCLC